MHVVSEVFASYQGEGLWVGSPSVFIRFFGCNLTCDGFASDRRVNDQDRVTRDSIALIVKENPDDFTQLSDLPRVTHGCDSYASWDSRFKNFTYKYTSQALRDICESCAHQKFPKSPYHIVFTGGEPLLRGRQVRLTEFLQYLPEMGVMDITFETNATQPLSEDFTAYIVELRRKFNIQVTFSMSVKLPVSGHLEDEALDLDAIATYTDDVADHRFLKFVVQSDDDLFYVRKYTKKVQSFLGETPVYLMPEGAWSGKEFSDRCRDVAGLCKTYGYRYSPRLQVHLWDNEWGT